MEFLVENKLFRVDKTVVTIRKEQPFTYYTRELDGDRLGDSDEKIIQAVIEQVRAELDPTSAIVQAQTKLQEAQAKLQETQAELEQAKQKLAETEQKATQTEAKQNDLEALANRINKVVRVMAQDSIMGEKIAYGTTYKELVELFPLAEEGKAYQQGDMFVIEDLEHLELNGEGKRVLIQTNQAFTYKGESIKQLEGGPSQNGLLAIWKWEGQKNESDLETTRVPAQ